MHNDLLPPLVAITAIIIMGY